MPPLVRALLLSLVVLCSQIAFAGQPSGMSMDFRTTTGSSVFHVGEVIPIQVSLSVLANPPRVLPIPAGIMHFQEPVIATLVANWNDLPEDFKARLLNELWLAVQSPLLLPILRSRAETGDQRALQRWMELDPVGAAEFLKNKNESFPKK